MVSCEFCKIFKEHLFCSTSPGEFSETFTFSRKKSEFSIKNTINKSKFWSTRKAKEVA